MTQVIVGRWSKNFAAHFSNVIATALQLRDGDHVEIEPQPDQIIIRRAKHRCTLEEMFAGRSPEEWHALYAEAYDWGSNVGRERGED
jgi:antitoxin component of MazEF toxin-antitoxin module